MDQEKFEQMQAIKNKLEDIKNSQASIVDKINHLITDLFQHPGKELEKAMEDAHQKSSENIESISEVLEDYEMKINKMENEG
tara:strand:- start:233 stop:478 length:246 start_codon:yes stop_codon:yes gene_type:complete